MGSRRGLLSLLVLALLGWRLLMGYQDQPVLSGKVASRGVADEFGGTLVSQATDAPATAIDPRVADYILYRVINGAFARGPLDPGNNIEPEMNPLPDWYGPVQASGVFVTGQWVTDTASPSGHSLRMTLNPGQGSDEAYFEQLVWVGGDRYGGLSHAVRVSLVSQSVSSGFGRLGIVTQYVKADGVTTTGAQVVGTVDTSGGAQALLVYVHATSPIPSDAAYLRIRVTDYRNTIPNAGTSVTDITNVQIITSSLELMLADRTTPAFVGSIAQDVNAISITPGGTQTTSLVLRNTSADVGMTLNGGYLRLTSIIAPVLASSPNNWNPAGIAKANIVTVDMGAANRTITGIDAINNIFAEGQTFWLFVYNAVGFTLSLTHNDALSTAGNRFSCPAGATQTVRNNAGLQIVYLPTKFANAPFQVVVP